MRKRTKAQMAAYQAGRRARLRLEEAAASSVPTIQMSTETPINVNTPLVNASNNPINVNINSDNANNKQIYAPSPISCPDCAQLRDSLTKEQAESARLRDMIKKFIVAEQDYGGIVTRLQARIAALETVKEPAKVPAPTQDVPIETRTIAPPQDDAQALAKRVIEQKVNRINNFGRNHCIGRV